MLASVAMATCQIAVACDMSTKDDPKSAVVRRYVELTPEAIEAQARVYQEQQRADVAFAEANGAVVVEGPWGVRPAQKVAYVGINRCGDRVVLSGINAEWRFNPVVGSSHTSNGEIEFFVSAPGILPKRICLGPTMTGMIVGRAQGQAPVQSHGVIDQKDYYFRSRGNIWSFSVGREPIKAPEWYYEERYGVWPDAGSISEDQAYQFIAKAAALYRAEHPTMQKPTLFGG